MSFNSQKFILKSFPLRVGEIQRISQIIVHGTVFPLYAVQRHVKVFFVYAVGCGDELGGGGLVEALFRGY